MLESDWLAIVFCVIGVISTLSSSFEWEWWWRLAKGVYLPDVVGRPVTRMLYLLTGVGGFVIGLGVILSPRMENTIVAPFIIATIISICLSSIIYSLRKGQKITDFFKREFYKK